MDMNKLAREMVFLVINSDEGVKGLTALCNDTIYRKYQLPRNEINHVLCEYVYFKAFLVSFCYFFSKGNMNDWDSVNKAYLPLLCVSLSHDFENYGIDVDNALNRYNYYWKVAMEIIKIQKNTHKIDVDKLFDNMCKEYIKFVGNDLFKRTNINYITLRMVVFKDSYDYIKKKIDSCNNGNNGGCYIATCVYGSYDCPEVWVLRRFRDSVLGETWIGKAFIGIYYRTSPALVGKFGKTVWFRRGCKYVLDKFVDVLRNRGLSDLPYRDKRW